MINTGKLAGKTLLIPGGNRCVSKEIALKTAKDVAKIFTAANLKPHRELLETTHATAESVEKIGDKGQGVINQQQEAPEDAAVQKDTKCYDLKDVNTRGTITGLKMDHPYIEKSSTAHILNLYSPHVMKYSWFKNDTYTMPKSNMLKSFGSDRTAINALWTTTNKKNMSFEFLFDEIKAFNRILLPKMSQQRRTMSTMAEIAESRADIEEIMTTLNEKFNADIVNETQAIYQFNITSGDSRVIYHIDLRNGSGKAGKGKSEESPDTIFCIDVENFNKLVRGNLKAPTAFMTGRMKINGSMQKAAKLEKLFVKLMDKY